LELQNLRKKIEGKKMKRNINHLYDTIFFNLPLSFSSSRHERSDNKFNLDLHQQGQNFNHTQTEANMDPITTKMVDTNFI